MPILLALFGAPDSKAEVVPYEVTFDATWSAATHPEAWTSSGHFSQLIGGTHNDSVHFWDVGELATLGIERMAEGGNKSPLDTYIQTAIDAGDAFSLISADNGIFSPGVAVEAFPVSSSHSLVTLVTMIAPSPDWFVGVSSFDLRPGGAWLDEVVIPLLPYDAGTDSGPDFTSPNDDTDPAELISQITGAPFGGTPPLGTFTFRLVREPGDTDYDCDVDFTDFNNLANNFTGTLDPGTGGKEWGHGDFDGDQDVDFDDFNDLANHYTGSGSGCKVGVPEPSTVALLLSVAGMGVLALVFRLRPSAHFTQY